MGIMCSELRGKYRLKNATVSVQLDLPDAVACEQEKQWQARFKASEAAWQLKLRPKQQLQHRSRSDSVRLKDGSVGLTQKALLPKPSEEPAVKQQKGQGCEHPIQPLSARMTISQPQTPSGDIPEPPLQLPMIMLKTVCPKLSCGHLCDFCFMQVQ